MQLPLLSALLLFLPLPAVLAPANWLLGGTWVEQGVPCPPQEVHKSITPKGMIFSDKAVVIQAPPVRPTEHDARFEARYDVEGHHIVAHLSQPQGALQLDMPFDEVTPDTIRDVHGFLYRRCGGADEDRPVS